MFRLLTEKPNNIKFYEKNKLNEFLKENKKMYSVNDKNTNQKQSCCSDKTARLCI